MLAGFVEPAAELGRYAVYWLRSHSIPLDRIYSGVILLEIGAIVLLLFFDIKARKEEAWLSHKFPEYDAYRSNVKKLIPWLY